MECQSDDYGDDENVLPPPPPPSYELMSLPSSNTSTASSRATSTTMPTNTSMLTESSSKASSRKRRTTHRNIEVAKQFHAFVLQMKCFCCWNDHIALRKHLIQSKKNVLKRILYKWTSYVQEIQMKRDSTIVLIELVEVARKKVMKFGLGRLHDHAEALNLVEKIFDIWREYSSIQRMEKMKKLDFFTASMSLQIIENCFIGWRSEANVGKAVCKKKRMLLCESLRGWNKEAKSQSHARAMRIKQAMLLIHDNNYNMMKKVFHILKSYSVAKKKYRRSLYHFVHKRAQRLMRKALQSWSAICINRHQQRWHMKKLIMKRTLRRWRASIEDNKLREHVFLQILLNRWKTLVDDRKERREKLLLAAKHWTSSLARRVISVWFKVTTERKGRLRTPPSHSSLSKMRLLYESNMGPRRCKVSEIHKDEQIEFHRLLHSMPKPFIPKRDVASTYSSGIRDPILPPSISRRRLTDDSMLRQILSQRQTQPKSIFDPPNNRYHACSRSLFDSSCVGMSSRGLDIPYHTGTDHKPRALSRNESMSHIRRRPIEELMNANNTYDNNPLRTTNIPSWILQDLSQCRSRTCNSNKNKAYKIPQDHSDILPTRAEPKQTGHQGMYRGSSNAAKTYKADSKDIKSSLFTRLSTNQPKMSTFKDSKDYL